MEDNTSSNNNPINESLQPTAEVRLFLSARYVSPVKKKIARSGWWFLWLAFPLFVACCIFEEASCWALQSPEREDVRWEIRTSASLPFLKMRENRQISRNVAGNP